MAGKVYEVVPADDDDDVALPDSDEAAAFQTFRDSLGEDEAVTTVRVYRCPTDRNGEVIPNGKLEMLFAAPVDRYNLDEIAEEVRAKFMDDSERVCTIRLIGSRKGVRGTQFNRTMVIRKAIEPRKAVEPARTDATILDAVQRMMEAQQARSDAIMREFFTRLEARSQPAPQADPVQTIAALMGAFTPIITAVAGRPVPEPAGGSLLEQIKALRELRGLAGDLTGGGGDGDGDGDDNSVVGIVKSVASVAAPVLQMMAQNQGQPRMVARRPALPAPTPAAPVAPVQNPAPRGAIPMPGPVAAAPAVPMTAEERAMLMMLREQLTALAQMAAEGADPKVAAEILLSQVPEAYDDRLYSLVTDANVVAKLSAVNAAVKPHAEWFAALAKAIADNYSQADDGEAAPPV